MDPTALPSTLRARALTRQADWAPKSEVGLVECGLLNPSPPARPLVRPTGGLPVRPFAPFRPFARPPDSPSGRPPDCLSAHPRVLDPVRASWAPSALLPLVRVSAPHGSHPPDRPRPFRPVCSSACPPDSVVSTRPSVHPSAPCTHRPPRPLAPSATSAPPARDNGRYIYPTPPPLKSSSSSQSALGPESLLRL